MNKYAQFGAYIAKLAAGDGLAASIGTGVGGGPHQLHPPAESSLSREIPGFDSPISSMRPSHGPGAIGAGSGYFAGSGGPSAIGAGATGAAGWPKRQQTPVRYNQRDANMMSFMDPSRRTNIGAPNKPPVMWPPTNLNFE